MSCPSLPLSRLSNATTYSSTLMRRRPNLISPNAVAITSIDFNAMLSATPSSMRQVLLPRRRHDMYHNHLLLPIVCICSFHSLFQC